MAVSTRDILLVIRAKDQASRVIRDVGLAFDNVSKTAEQSALRTIGFGAALTGIGVATAAVGVKILSTLKGWTDMAIEYRQQSALTLTQVTQLGVSLADIENIGIRVASKIPVPFKQVQASLYDIFSSMDVNAQQAETLLTAFAKAAVAGQTDIQTAGRATIALMNAYKVPIEDVNKVLDFQFRLVQKGVGTYEEFATTIGRSIPSARRAGQTYETLGGVLAFLTRNGLSTTMAATSAARAFDSLANVKVVERLQKMGVQVLDANGNFLQMDDIVRQLSSKLAGLTDPQKAAALQELFKGAGGTIQARRFWDLAIRNYDELQQRIDEMRSSAGGMEAAYKLMFEQPQSMMQLFKNNLDALKISIGQALIPVLNSLVQWGTKIIQMFNALPASTKETIAKIILITGLVLTLGGALLGLIGILLLVKGAIALLGGFSSIIGGIISLLPWLALLALAGYIIYRNWDTIKATAAKVWPYVKDAILKAWNAVYSWAQKNWPKIEAWVIGVWNRIKEWAIKNWPQIRDTIVNVWNWIWDKIQWVWDKLVSFYNWLVSVDWKKVWEDIKNAVLDWYNKVKEWVDKIWKSLNDFWDWLTNTFGPGFKTVWDEIKKDVVPILENLWGIITQVAKAFAGLVWALYQIGQFFVDLGNKTGVFRDIWSAFGQQIAGIVEVIRGVLEILNGILHGDWSLVWQGFVHVAEGAWKQISAYPRMAINWLWQGVQVGMEWGRTLWSTAWNGIQIILQGVWGAMQGIVMTAFNIIASTIGNVLGQIQATWNTGWLALQTLLSSVWATMQGVVLTAFNVIASTIGNVLGQIQGIWSTAWNALLGILQTIWGQMSAFVSTAINSIQLAIAFALGILGGVWNTFWNSLGAAVSTAFGVISGIVGSIIGAIQTLIGWIEKAIGFIGRLASAAAGVPGIGGGGINVPGIGGVPGLGTIIAGAGAVGGAVASGVTGAISGIAGFLGGQHGNTFPVGSWGITGEAGPELFNVTPFGAKVYANRESRRMLTSSASLPGSHGGITISAGAVPITVVGGDPIMVQEAVYRGLNRVIREAKRRQ